MTDLSAYKGTEGGDYRVSKLNQLIDRLQLELNGINVSGLASVSDRTELAAEGQLGARHLAEARHQGIFLWDGTDLSAKVTADTAQAVYVAPSTDTTGASGAWVRQYEHLIFDWFGAVPGDYATGISADCSQAWDDLHTFLAAHPRNRSAFYQCAGPMVLCPGNQYYFSGLIQLTRQIHLKGFGSGQYNEATWFRFPANSGGLLIKDGDFTPGGSIIEGITFQGNGGDAPSGDMATDLLKSGIRLVSRATIRDCYVRNFAGAGICVSATFGASDANYYGNANNWRIEDCTVESNKCDGVFVSGGDANAGYATGVNAQYNGLFGIRDNSFLGNAWIGCHSAGNGGGWCFDEGRLYYARHYATLAQLQATAPADSLYWIDVGEYGAADAGHPQWTGSLVVTPGGAYGGTAGYSSYFGCYYETGQAPPQPNGIVIGGFMGDGIVPTSMLGIAGGLAAPNRFSVPTTHIGERTSKVVLGGVSETNHDSVIEWNAPEATAGFDTERCFGLAFDRRNGNLVYAGAWSNGSVAIGEPAGTWGIKSGLGTMTFGRALPSDIGGVMHANSIGLGVGDNARIMTMGSAAPTSGSHGKGERVFNDGSVTDLATVNMWVCTVSGTPGTWVAK